MTTDRLFVILLVMMVPFDPLVLLTTDAQEAEDNDDETTIVNNYYYNNTTTTMMMEEIEYWSQMVELLIHPHLMEKLQLNQTVFSLMATLNKVSFHTILQLMQVKH